MPRSCTDIVTPPMSNVRFGNGLSNTFVSPPQIQPTSPLIAIRSPIVTITITISGRCSTGRIAIRSTATPPRNANASVSANAGQ